MCRNGLILVHAFKVLYSYVPSVLKFNCCYAIEFQINIFIFIYFRVKCINLLVMISKQSMGFTMFIIHFSVDIWVQKVPQLF